MSLRDYRSGDPLRHIHWRSWARTGRLIVKEYQDEFFVRHALVLDTFGEAEDAHAFEEAVSLAASFACSVSTQESLLDLMFIGARAVCLTTGRGVGHAEQALEILATVELCRDHPIDLLERLLLQHVARVCGCICILLAWDEPRRQLIRRLQSSGLPLLVLVVTGKKAAQALRDSTDTDRPERFHIVEAGRVEEQLAGLAGSLSRPGAP